MAHNIGEVLTGEVTGVKPFGAFVKLDDGSIGMVHISEVAGGFVSDISQYLKTGDSVRVMVIESKEAGKTALSIKRAAARDQRVAADGDDFEKMLSRFKKQSEEKLSDIKQGESARRSSRKSGQKHSK